MAALPPLIRGSRALVSIAGRVPNCLAVAGSAGSIKEPGMRAAAGTVAKVVAGLGPAADSQMSDRQNSTGDGQGGGLRVLPSKMLSRAASSIETA